MHKCSINIRQEGLWIPWVLILLKPEFFRKIVLKQQKDSLIVPFQKSSPKSTILKAGFIDYPFAGLYDPFSLDYASWAFSMLR